jgi:hypothetical protein
VARILSYNVETYKDVANLRLFCLLTLLPSLAAANGHHIQVPPKRHGSRAFPNNLGAADNYEFDGNCVTTGEVWVVPPEMNEAFHLFEGARAKEMRFLKLPLPPPWRRKSEKIVSEQEIESTTLQGDDAFISAYRLIVEAMDEVQSVKLVQQLYEAANKSGLFEPISPQSEIEELTLVRRIPRMSPIGPFAVMLNLTVPADAICVMGKEGDNMLLLNTQALTKSDTANEIITFVAEEEDRTHRALIRDSGEDTYYVSVFMNVIADSDRMYEMAYGEDCETVPLCFEEFIKEYQNQTLVEGVAVVDGFLSLAFCTELQRQIDTLSEIQRAESRVDYHPNSKDVLRDLVHPALYPYIKDVTPLRSDVNDVEPASFPALNAVETDVNMPDAVDPGRELDFWGRPYENSVYQWLPTYFVISEDGQCTIEDYINNMVPRERYSDLYGCLATLFGEALPYIESVYSYVQAVRPHFRKYEDYYEHDSVEPLSPTYIPLRGQRLQVIIKIVDYELHVGQSHDGVFHVEGMSHEEVVLTCLYILDRDEQITGGDLLFKHAYLTDEVGTFVMTMPQCRHPRQDEIVQEGLLPLGRVETRKGRLVVFPNSHVHKVDTLINTALAVEDGGIDDVATRRIIVFFLVNPLKRIVSTREVTPQQVYAGGTLPLDDALAHRINLMKERKYHK